MPRDVACNISGRTPRRKLRDVFDSTGSKVAAEGLRRIAEFYAIEADIRGASPERRRAERQARTAPLVEEFGVWLKEQRARVSAKSRLGEALAYVARYWGGLGVFLDDGRVEMDSNAVENRIRPLALTRKNALLAGHDEGAAAWGRIASLIETAKMNGVEPYAYLKATLEAIAAGHPASRDRRAPALGPHLRCTLSSECPAGPCACVEAIAGPHSFLRVDELLLRSYTPSS